MQASWQLFVHRGALVAWMSCASVACVNTTTAAEPTHALARTAMELHAAEQAGARHDREGRALFVRAEEALEAARRSAFRGRYEEAERQARAGYAWARRARARGELHELVPSSARVTPVALAHSPAP